MGLIAIPQFDGSAIVNAIGAAGTRIIVWDGTTDALVVAAQGSLYTDLWSIRGANAEVNSGNLGAGVLRVAIATDDVNVQAMRIALQLIDDAVAVYGAAHVATGLAIAVLGKDNIPVAVDEGDAVSLLADRLGQLFIKGYNRAQGSLDVSVVAQTKIPPLIEDGWVALDTPGQVTPTRDVRDYKNHTVVYIIANINTSVDLIVWGRIDGANPFPMDSWTVLAANPQTNAREISGMQVSYIYAEFDAEVGGVAATVTFQLSSGD